MMRFILMAMLALALPAQAADYPFNGFFSVGPPTNSGETQSAEEARNNCANAFFYQKADGRFAYFVIDRAAFETTGVPSYALTQEATCNFDAATQSEDCQDKRSVYGESGEIDFATLYQSIGQDKLVFRGFASLAEMQSYVKGQNSEVGTPFEAYRCPFREDQIARYLTAELTKMTADEVMKVLVLAPNAENTAFLKRVLKVILGG
jgi:hypothetical protein